MKGIPDHRSPSPDELVLMLYGSFTRLDDLFKLQATGSHIPTSEEFDEALVLNHALTAIVTEMLASTDGRTQELRRQLLHSSIGPIAEIARAASRRTHNAA